MFKFSTLVCPIDHLSLFSPIAPLSGGPMLVAVNIKPSQVIVVDWEGETMINQGCYVWS